MALIYQQGDRVECQLLCEGEGQQGLNQVYLQMKATTPLPTTFRDRIETQFLPPLRRVQSHRALWWGIKHRRILPNPEASYTEQTFQNPPSGLRTANLSHEGLSTILAFRVNGWPQEKSGRIYIPFSGLGYINGFFDSSSWGAQVAMQSDMQTRFAFGGSDAFFTHQKRYKEGGQYFYVDVVSYHLRPFLGMIRRRRKFYGD